MRWPGGVPGWMTVDYVDVIIGGWGLINLLFLKIISSVKGRVVKKI